MLKVQNLAAKAGAKAILRGINLTVKPGELVALLGPNASGKSSLAQTLTGNPSYQIINGELIIDNVSIKNLKPDERVKMGLFLAWQNPVAVRGVTVEQLLRRAVINCRDRICKRIGQLKRCVRVGEFRSKLKSVAGELKINPELLFRDINVNFSGGEKKKLQLLELIVLNPRYAILDEIDSGLDIDALKLAARIINQLREETRMGVLLITHYARIFQFLKPDKVLVMKAGQIAASGGQELIERIEREGYEEI